MNKNKKQGGRIKKVGWVGYSGTISGEVREAISLISAFQNRRDSGEIVDELLRKAGILDLLDTLLHERLAQQASRAKKKVFDEWLSTNPEYHRIFAECVFEELERTHKICSFEAALKTRGYFPEFEEVDAWRHRKVIPFEYHQGIRLYLGRTGWDARLESFTRSLSSSNDRSITRLATGTTDSPMF